MVLGPEAAAYPETHLSSPSEREVQLKVLPSPNPSHAAPWQVERTVTHHGRLGLRLLDQASGAGGLGSGEDHLPPQVHRQQVQPQVHDHGGHRLQRKTSGEWRSEARGRPQRPLSAARHVETRGVGDAFVQMYTGAGVDGMTERNFRIHLQLWDTAGQER